jgi:F420-dependent oxidoreductase-like protein
MKVGLQIPDYTWGPTRNLGPTLVRIARAADEAGFEMIGVPDHLWQVSPWMGPVEHEMLECYTTLAFLAAHTSRATLMAMVTGAHLRHPSVLAKSVTTLDVLSGGRVWLGIGAGYYEEETRGLGVQLPPMAERFERLEDAIQICLRMWTGDHGDDLPFEGRHFRLERALNSPQALTRPHPPILIGGEGERKTLRLVARYADACGLFPTPELSRKLDVLRSHCEAEGRNYDDIYKTCGWKFDVGENGAKAGETIERLQWLSGMGIDMVLGSVEHVERIEPLDVMGREVIPTVANLEPTGREERPDDRVGD